MLRVANIKMKLEHKQEDLRVAAATVLNVSVGEIRSFSIAKKSLDARDKDRIFYVYSVDVVLQDMREESKYVKRDVSVVNPFSYVVDKSSKGKKPVVVGSGPAGLFAGLVLAEAGLCPILLERGKDVDRRIKDVQQFLEKGVFLSESNIVFGEGGAGTFSDGKLTTGIKDSRKWKVIQELLSAGAPEEIGYWAKPHIGTDRLILVLKKIRAKIIELGGEFRFENKLTGIQTKENMVYSVLVEENGNTYALETDAVVLAIGHSARDTMEMLLEHNLRFAPKAFSVGVRIEHSQKMINESQYGKFAQRLKHIPAEYKLNINLNNGRGVYTFCMCPGGVVVPSVSEPGHLVTNGMSNFARDAENANSALLVSVSPSDFPSDHPLAGIAFQRTLEKKAFEWGGGNYNAPVQLVGDFLKGKKTTSFYGVTPSYKPGVVGSNLHDFLDGFLTDSLRQGIVLLDKRLNGFSAYDAVLTAVETRSSSPVVMKRDSQSLAAEGFVGVYPCGEGAGYAGGIVSAAVDGIKIAEQILYRNNSAV